MIIAGLDPAIHDESARRQIAGPSVLQFSMDARVEPAHDDGKE
jgi:hypothetical protein